METDKDLLREAKRILKATIQRKKGIFFQDTIQENSKNSKELWKTLKSLGLNSKKTGQSKICLQEDGVIQFEPKKNANIFKKFFSELAGNLVKKKNPEPPLKFKQKEQRCSTKNENQIQKNLNFYTLRKTSLKNYYVV